MEISDCLRRQIESDLGLNVWLERGQDIPVRNCWHFSTDGKAVEVLFFDKDDYRDAMNRLFIMARRYGVVILAFVLMDTHVHFILYGTESECSRAVHDFVKRTSMSISARHGLRHQLFQLPVHRQSVDTLSYLRKAICYVLRNPLVAGICSNYYDYPWSSGALMFREAGLWTAARWMTESRVNLMSLTDASRREILRSRDIHHDVSVDSDGLVFPGEYVATGIAERVFRTGKSFFFTMCSTRESDIETLSGSLSHLSIPIAEMRQHRNELCRDLFNRPDARSLCMADRIRLARALRSRYGSSLRQIARVCGLIYSEVKDLL